MGLPSWEAIFTFLGGVVVATIAAFGMRPKNVAEADKANAEGEASLSNATITWAKELRADLRERLDDMRRDYDGQLAKMTARLTELDAENRLYRKYNHMLIVQIKDAGLIPVPPPTLGPDDD